VLGRRSFLLIILTGRSIVCIHARGVGLVIGYDRCRRLLVDAQNGELVRCQREFVLALGNKLAEKRQAAEEVNVPGWPAELAYRH
jgi:hypothetical protein